VDPAEGRLGLRVADRHLLGQIGEEEDPERAVEQEGRAGVGHEEGHRQHHARDDHRGHREEAEHLVARDEAPIRDVGEQGGERGPDARSEHASSMV